MEQRQRTRLASAAILAVVFATGGLVGMAVDRSLTGGAADPETPVGPQAGPADDVPTGAREGRGNRPARPIYYQQVGLSAEALQIADSVVREGRERSRVLEEDFRHDMDSLRMANGGDARSLQFRKDMDGVLTQMRDQIKSLMTPEQVVRYDSLLAAAEAKRRADEQRRREGRENRPPPDHR